MVKKKKGYILYSKEYQKKLKEKLERNYRVLVVDTLDEADLLIVPVEEKLKLRQNDFARYTNIGEIVFVPTESLLEDDYNVVLDKFLERKIHEKERINDELDYGMEL